MRELNRSMFSKDRRQEEEEWEFIANRKGRYGWAHHPYTQNTKEVPISCWGIWKSVLSKVLTDYASTIFSKDD